MADETRPAWSLRLTAERKARGWTQQRTVDVLRMHSDQVLPDDSNLLRMWKNWEAGRHRPGPECQRTIAAALGSVAASIFGPESVPLPRRLSENFVVPGDNTIELVERIRRSDIERASLDTLTITDERLCSEYAFMLSIELRQEGQEWLAKLVQLLGQRLTLAQYREVLVLAGWLTLLVGCVEYDTKDLRGAEATRRAAATLGQEADHAGIMAWSQEMTCWFSLTQGQYRQVIEAARTGHEIAPRSSVAVQLAGQEAKAWARLGDRRQVELALEPGRLILESLPYPDNIDNHFTVDPDKFDFYAMDCFRRIGEDAMATIHAHKVIRKATAPDGSLRSPMRGRSSHHARSGVGTERRSGWCCRDGNRALDIPRQSVPPLLMVTDDPVTALRQRYDNEPETTDHLDRIGDLANTA